MNKSKTVPEEYAEYLLMDKYKCTPSELEEEDFYTTSLHLSIMNIEGEYQELEKNRANQRAKLSN